MRTMFNSVTRIFRRRSLFSLSLSPSPSASPSTTSSAAPPRKSKSRHELVSEAHVAYMQEHQQRQQERLLLQSEQERWSRPRRQSSSSSSPPPSPSCSSMASSLGEDVLSLSPFESLCLELCSVEDSIYRSLRAPASGYASDPIYFH
jgi:hypothetical protein